MKLSILIPTLSSRSEQCLTLVDKLLDQVERGNYIGLVEVVTLYDSGEKPTGQKRNELIQMAKGDYVCFVDDDDEVSANYIDLIMEGIAHEPDCCSLKGVYTVDGNNPEVFEHSLKYNAWRTNDTGVPKYERYPNHLNVVKKSIANQVKFPEIVFGEDKAWSDEVHSLGLIKDEYYIDNVLYHYKFVTNK